MYRGKGWGFTTKNIHLIHHEVSSFKVKLYVDISENEKKLPEGNFLSNRGSDFTTSQVPRQSSQQRCASGRHGPGVHKHARKGYFYSVLSHLRRV